MPPVAATTTLGYIKPTCIEVCARDIKSQSSGRVYSVISWEAEKEPQRPVDRHPIFVATKDYILQP
jgi:hypothetical protein